MNTLFTRTVLLSVAILLGVHGGYRLLARTPWLDAGITATADATLADAPAASRAASPASTAGIRPMLSIKPRIVDLAAPLVPRLASLVWPSTRTADTDADAAVDDLSASGDDTPAIGLRLAPLLLSLPVALIVLCIYWFRQTRHSLGEVARMARESDRCDARPALKASAGDVRLLARTFSELMHRQSRALDDQSAALDAFSRQLDGLVGRLRARALKVSHWHKRVAFIEDIDLFSNVARQFVDVAGRGHGNESGHADAANVAVDTYLHDRYYHGSTMDGARIILSLRAGRDFMLPRAALERLIGNLVGNALAHGAPPVEIATLRGARTWTLSVRDHGRGIGEHDLSAVIQPFVRLPSVDDSETSGQRGDHWGLGLAIVSRLAQSCGAKLKLGNHPDGGLWVRVIVPMV